MKRKRLEGQMEGTDGGDRWRGQMGGTETMQIAQPEGLNTNFTDLMFSVQKKLVSLSAKLVNI